MMAGGTDAHSGHPGHSLEPALTHSDSLMEVDTKDNTGMEDGLTYQIIKIVNLVGPKARP